MSDDSTDKPSAEALAVADRILAEMRGGPVLAVSPARSREILARWVERIVDSRDRFGLAHIAIAAMLEMGLSAIPVGTDLGDAASLTGAQWKAVGRLFADAIRARGEG